MIFTIFLCNNNCLYFLNKLYLLTAILTSGRAAGLGALTWL